MLLFASDIDNTLIYSCKNQNITSRIPCELYEGKYISFITEYTREKLEYVHEKAIFVPVTTRSIEQYKRIEFGNFIPDYAITSNGGNLLIKGSVDEDWYNETLSLCQHAFYGMEKGRDYLEKDNNRELDIKLIDGLFVYTKSSMPEKTVNNLKELLIDEPVNVYNYRNKIYILPNNLDKGSALKRFINKCTKNIDKIITAGDSVFDIPLLNTSDYAIFPSSLDYTPLTDYLKIEEKIFSDELLKEVIIHL